MDDNLLIKLCDENVTLCDNDVTNYFNLKSLESKYYSISESNFYLQQNKNTFSILNINIRSLNKNFDDFKLLMHELNHDFKIICFTETWCKYDEHNFQFELANYAKKIEIINQNSKNVIVNVIYRQPAENANGNTKQTWNAIKEIIGQNKYKNNVLPKKLLIDGETIYDKALIAEELNSFFINVSSNLAQSISLTSSTFDSYLTNSNKKMNESKLDIRELRTALLSLKSNKSAGSDKVSVNILKLVYDIIEPSLFHIFNQSLKSGKVPDKLKIARVTPVFKSGDESEPSNYRPISVLSCFSKLLERIVYNRLYNHLTENNMLYSKQFGFKKQHSTDHAIVELVNHLSNAFKEDYYTLGVFIYLSKAFDTVNHSILIKNWNITE
ncbi:uncharacterized protein LOC136085582 [Hydra vulgaris]|uniref:Uncharacterized protein LOC136085582 n=1 Tax=Hydra vulgaris TaxID=6087 RepID=A0ABM4CMD8_HYDVU